MDGFFETQVKLKCGLHAIHNLLSDTVVSENDLSATARDICQESGDVLANHESRDGNWSMDVLLRTLQKYKYGVERTRWKRGHGLYTMQRDLNDRHTVGYIVYDPERRHFTSMRKRNDRWEYVDSTSRACELTPLDFCKRCEANWTAFKVTAPKPAIVRSKYF